MFTAFLLLYCAIAVGILEVFHDALNQHPSFGGVIGILLGALAFILATISVEKYK